MAKDPSRKPTKRQKTSINAARPGGASQPQLKFEKSPKASIRQSNKAKSSLKATPQMSVNASRKTKRSRKPSLLNVVSGKGIPQKPQPTKSQFSARIAAKIPTPSRKSDKRPTTGQDRRARYQRGQAFKAAGIVAAVLASLALVLVVAFFILRSTSLFTITSVEVEPTTHVSESDIEKLVQVPLGSTLLNVDTTSIEASLKKNPWVANAEFTREFPSTLKITIEEQKVSALVVMSSGSLAWYIGENKTWIQPTSIATAEGQSVNDAALQEAMTENCLLVTDVPATVQPTAGSAATDDMILAVEKFRDEFSHDFTSQIVSFSAPTADAITCTLKSGVEVLLGSATDIASKEEIVSAYLQQHPGTITYINVRVITNPSVRVVDSSNAEAGSGVTSSDDGSDSDSGSGNSN